jgi:hypothetical protein
MIAKRIMTDPTGEPGSGPRSSADAKAQKSCLTARTRASGARFADFWQSEANEDAADLAIDGPHFLPRYAGTKRQAKEILTLRLRRAAPIRPKPQMNIAHVAGSGAEVVIVLLIVPDATFTVLPVPSTKPLSERKDWSAMEWTMKPSCVAMNVSWR